ncbi:MAG: hypothetical protein NT178_07780 [Proteobacteria bacterium]|nr:hypothetical protein [Pseudomonadota bacterium]
MGANIIVCTLIMWGLTAVAVMPLARLLFKNALVGNSELVTEGGSQLAVTDELITEHSKLYTVKFIQADVIVMGIAGFVAGLAGFPLIGFAWKAKAWPGLIALIAASFIGCRLAGHPGIF